MILSVAFTLTLALLHWRIVTTRALDKHDYIGFAYLRCTFTNLMTIDDTKNLVRSLLVILCAFLRAKATI